MGTNRVTHRYGREVAVELARLWGVLTMNEAKLAPENYHTASAARSSTRKFATLTLLRAIKVVWPVTKTAQVLCKADPRAQLRIENVAFVHEQNQLNLFEQLIRADSLPQKYRVFLWVGQRRLGKDKREDEPVG